MKKYFLGVLSGVALSIPMFAFADNGLEQVTAYLRKDLPILLDGQKLELKNPPLIYDGSTYLPLKEAAAALGKEAKWNEQTQSVEIGNNNKGDTVSIDGKTDTTNSTSKDTSPVVTGDRENIIIYNGVKMLYMMKIMQVHESSFFDWEIGKEHEILDLFSIDKSKKVFEKTLMMKNVPHVIYQGGIYIDLEFYTNNIKPKF
ncbi:copper amine oxidase N-terminal domain-containing protein [Paenibacillus radicis (ex Xue et al. 2023)]|uniref:Copper amine oxidase N-terminal domain-containing protein n=1 Tax=Paenibacillus radicis (ex Xue et al. 2023) TaxID=2972489 RepID=A0ABT1YK00_9BACL|nr:copper amine oxidase N-terminal domain-containing protein [Paenibacillus radicis (ex Xue et al. 2023)]MCR8633501.1 copper amine oxidase N-terminal domain-containing protein [Paenibacillus radicis (ex Xue et al. 2023)]